MVKVFSCQFSKTFKAPFLQNTSGRLFLLSAFQRQPLEVFYEKDVLENFAKFTGKHLWFWNFQKHFFYRTPLDDCFWLFRATLLRWGAASSFWKTSDDSLSRNTNFRSTLRVYHVFFDKINFNCMSSLVKTVYCQKQPSE